MNRELEKADPAAGFEVDRNRLRALVDARIGLSSVAQPASKAPMRRRRPWIVGVAAFAAVFIVAVPFLLSRVGSGTALFPRLDTVSALPGVDAVVPLASGGVQTMGTDGESIWVMTALQNRLQRVSPSTGRIEDTFEIDGHVEGVVVGGGHVWLMSYDNGGEVLRFDVARGAVDKRVPLDGFPGFARWFGGRLFVSNDRGELVEISPAAEVVSTTRGVLKGDALGLLWVHDPTDGSIRSLSVDGSVGRYVMPGGTAEFGDLGLVRSVGEAGGYVWAIFGEASEDVGRFDPATGEFLPIHGGRWLHSLTEHNGAFWATSITDDLLIRIDPSTGELKRFAVPGKPGGLLSTDGTLWVLLHQPGSLIGLDTSKDLIEAGEEIVSVVGDSVSGAEHSLVCTVGGSDSESLDKARVDRRFAGLGPTIILETPSWISPGIWSVVQARLSAAGAVVCASGYSGGEATPEQRAADLEDALGRGRVLGPYLLVAAGDAAHTARVFADGRADLAAVVFVEPMPAGFQEYYDGLLGEEFVHPPWLDLDPAISETLGDLGSTPVVVIGHDPDDVFLSDQFIEASGKDKAQAVSDYWQQGLAFYADLSVDSRRIVASGTGLDGVFWFQPDLIVDAVLESIP